MPIASLALSAQQWCDEELRDPNGQVADLLREIATEVETNERIFVPRRTGATFASIFVSPDEDPNTGYLEERIYSRNPQTSILSAKAGFIWNRSPRGQKHTRGIRESHPFPRTALITVERVGL